MEVGDSQEALRYYQKGMEILEKMPSVEAGVCIFSGLCSVYSDLGMKNEAMQIAIQGVNRFPDGDPGLYQNLANTFIQMGWREDARKVLKAGLKKFPNDEELTKSLREVEENMDDPDGGGRSTLLGMVLLLASIHRNLRRRRQL